MNIVAIDLGTTFSVVAYVDDDGNPQVIANEHGERSTPSAVIFNSDGTVGVGKVAINQWIANEDRVSRWIKRRMRDNDYRFHDKSPVEISAIILEALKKAAEAVCGPIDEVVITCPAYFNAMEIENTRKAGELAGFHVKEIVKEPTAAAVRHGVQHLSEGDTFVVCDLGGGTYDACVMRMEAGDDGQICPSPVCTSGSRTLGGHDWTEALQELACERLAEEFGEDPRSDKAVGQYLYESCEKAKREFALSTSVEIACQFGGQFASVTIDRQDFEDRTESMIGSVVAETQNAVVHKAGLDWTDLKQIILVGGSSRLRRLKLALAEKYVAESSEMEVPELSSEEALQKLAADFQQETGKEMVIPQLADEPDYAVALGAAMISRGQAKPKRINERNLGTVIVRTGGDKPELVNSAIIERGCDLDPPPSVTKPYEIGHDGQKLIEVPVIEFDDVGMDEGFCTYQFECPTGVKQGDRIDITFEYTLSGEILVNAYDVTRDQKLLGDRVPFEPPRLESGGGALSAVFLLDISISMRGDKISLARQAIITNAEALLEKSKSSEVGVVAFGSAARTLVDLTSDPKLVERHVSTVEVSGGTSMELGLEEAQRVMQSASHKRVMIMVTDGMPANQAATLAAADRVRADETEIYTLALGTGSVDEEFLAKLSPHRFVIDDFDSMGECMSNFLSQAGGGGDDGPAQGGLMLAE